MSDDIFSKLEQFKNELTQSLETAIRERNQAQSDLEKLEKTLATTVEDLKAQQEREVSALNQEHRRYRDELERKHADILLAIDKGHRGLMEQSRKKHEEELESLQAQHQTALAKVEQEASTSVEQLQQQHQLALSSLETQLQELQAHSSDRQQNYESQIEETNQRYREEIESLRERLTIGEKTTIEEMELKSKQQIETLEHRHEEALATLQQQHIEQLKALQDAQRLQNEQNSLNQHRELESRLQEAEAAQANLQEQLEQLQKRADEAEKQKTLEEKRNVSIKDALERATREVESGQRELAQLHQETGRLKDLLHTSESKAPLLVAAERAEQAERDVHRLEGLLVSQQVDLSLINNDELRHTLSQIEEASPAPTTAHESQVLVGLLKTELGQLLGQASNLASENSELRYRLKKFEEAPVIVPEAQTASAPPGPNASGAAGQDLELQRLAFEDKVTGLPNIRLGHQYLAQSWGRAERKEISLGLAQVDVQELDLINQNFGYCVGDEVLRQVGHYLRHCINSEDVVVRGEHDDFWVVATHPLGSPAGLKGLCDRLISNIAKCVEALSQPLSCHGNLLRVSIRAGVAVTDTGVTPEELQHHCQVALRAAQEKGPNQVLVYRSDMENQSRRNKEIVPLLQSAIQSQQLTLRFQPIYNLRTRQLWASEALTRWDHQRHGLMECKEFIEAAKESGLIVPMGQWLLQELGLCGSNLLRGSMLCLNFSARELMQADFTRRLTKLVESLRTIRPEQFVLEIPESDLVRPNHLFIETLRALRRWNVGLAIDDYTGVVPISQIQRLKIGYLKLHVDLLRKADTKAGRDYLQSLVQMGSTLDCQLIAKNIENVASIEHCLEIGIELAQGYFLAKPVRIGDLADHHTLASVPLPQVPENSGHRATSKIPPRPKVR